MRRVACSLQTVFLGALRHHPSTPRKTAMSRENNLVDGYSHHTDVATCLKLNVKKLKYLTVCNFRSFQIRSFEPKIVKKKKKKELGTIREGGGEGEGQKLGERRWELGKRGWQLNLVPRLFPSQFTREKPWKRGWVSTGREEGGHRETRGWEWGEKKVGAGRQEGWEIGEKMWELKEKRVKTWSQRMGTGREGGWEPWERRQKGGRI